MNLSKNKIKIRHILEKKNYESFFFPTRIMCNKTSKINVYIKKVNLFLNN